MLTVRLEDIRSGGLLLGGVADSGLLAELTERLVGEQIRLLAPVGYRFRLVRSHDLVEIDGQVTTQVEIPCGRCLSSYPADIDEAFSLTYAERLPEVVDENGEEGVEISAEEMGIELLAGEEIDLAEPLLENLIVALPLLRLCSEGCKGLCPQCGIDRNTGTCNCVEPQFDTRFAALKNLKLGPPGGATGN